MSNIRFIKVDYYNRYAFRDHSTNADLLKSQLKSAHIRLDCFLEVGELENHEVHDHGDIVNTINVSHCYLTRVEGLGINGVASDVYLTEESYKTLSIILDL